MLSPPRASSTAFCRVLWGAPAIAHYAHEPYEAAYFGNPDGVTPKASLSSPLPLVGLTAPKAGRGLLIKEISFQIAAHFPDLACQVTAPVVFLVRDPRLTVESRRNVRRAQGASLDFPLEETGWAALADEIQYCREHGVDYCIVDAGDFRAHPAAVFPTVCARLGMDFDDSQLTWTPAPRLTLSNHRNHGPDHFFTRVLASRGIELPVERVPGLTEFPAGELREHVRWALGVYRSLLADSRRIPPASDPDEPVR